MFNSKFLLVAVLALSLGFISCSSDDDDDQNNDVKYPKTLTYKKTEFVDFKMYVGSEEGGKEVSTTDLNPANYWDARWIKEDLEFAEGFSLKFVDKDTVTIINKFDSETYTTIYKFDGDKLCLFDKEENEWDSDEEIQGDKNKIIIKSGFTHYNKIVDSGSASGSGSHSESVGMADLIGKGEAFESLSDMKHKEDTVMWYNIHYIYE